MEQQKKKSESHGVEVFLAWQPNQEVKPPPQWKQKPRFAVGADKKVYFRQATSMSIARWLVRRVASTSEVHRSVNGFVGQTRCHRCNRL